MIDFSVHFQQLEGYEFDLRGTATDGGDLPRNASVKVSITVTSSVAKPPSFVEPVVSRYSSIKEPGNEGRNGRI